MLGSKLIFKIKWNINFVKYFTKSGLNIHINTGKYCLKIQGKDKTTKYKCENCNKYLSTTKNINRYQHKCNIEEI